MLSSKALQEAQGLSNQNWLLNCQVLHAQIKGAGCGVVWLWCGVMWCGCGEVWWCGVVWCGVVPCSVVRCGVVVLVEVLPFKNF